MNAAILKGAFPAVLAALYAAPAGITVKEWIEARRALQ